MGYEVRLKPSAKKVLDALPKPDQTRFIEALEQLAGNPRHHGVVKLESESNLYRVRIGNYRAVYTIEDDRLVVLVVKIGHRREVYR
ncbi:MAG: type II toxin-antitoxin system RelE/ParE family toxin [Methylococcaceae bacterium]|nr:type II toxin-antitoxin system RelE/ParE family toxin [Methylococcaceae bacterium]